MNKTIHSSSRRNQASSSPPKKLNTKGCCFLCLQIVEFNTNTGGSSKTSSTIKPEAAAVSLRCFLRYLKLNRENPAESSTKDPSRVTNDENIYSKFLLEKEFEVDLCQTCEKIVNRFSKSFLSLEKFRMEVDYWMELIHQQISEASKKPELVQNYSKRMTNDLDSLAHLVLAEKLRKEIAEKSSEESGSKALWPKVELIRLNNIENYSNSKRSAREGDESEFQETKSQFEEGDFDDAAGAPPPPPPLGAVVTEEDCKNVTPIPTPDIEENDDEGPNADCPSSSVSSSSTLTNSTDSDDDDIPRISNVFSIKEAKMYNENPKARSFDCTLCQKTFKSIVGARLHYEAAHLGKRYKCERCGRGYTQNAYLKTHEKRCRGGTGKKRSLKINKKEIKGGCFASSSTHANNSDDENVPQNASVFRIKKTKMYRKNCRTGTFDCTLCKKQLTTRSGAGFHYKSAHLGFPYQCNVCGNRYSDQKSLDKHKKRCSGGGGAAVLPTIMKNKGEGPEGKLQRWSFFNSQTGKFECVKCKQGFAQKSTIHKHYDAIHLNKRVQCDICKKLFTRSANLSQHKISCRDYLAKQQARETDPRNKFPCKFCGVKFLNKTRLAAHQKAVHFKEKNFECHICGRKFLAGSLLKWHMDVFHLGRKLNCKFCKKPLSYKGTLKRHEEDCPAKKKKFTMVKTETVVEVDNN